MSETVHEQAGLSVLDVPVARVAAPGQHLQAWISDPDLPLTVPGFRLCAPTTDLPFTIVFHASKTRRITHAREARSVAVEGDLESFRRRDFRRLLMHVAKAVVKQAGRCFVHAACVIDRHGRAVLLGGSPGSGKSTLTVALARQGYQILSTDVTLIDSTARACAGTRHVTLYPEVIKRCCPEFRDWLPADAGAEGDCEKKLAVPFTSLQERGYFYIAADSVPIGHVFQLSIGLDEPVAYCAAMSGQEKLRNSLVLGEDWAASIWLCPSWRIFFPELQDASARAQAHRIALRLTEVPHSFLCGDVDAAISYVKASLERAKK